MMDTMMVAQMMLSACPSCVYFMASSTPQKMVTVEYGLLIVDMSTRVSTIDTRTVITSPMPAIK